MLTLLTPRASWEPFRAGWVLDAYERGERTVHVVAGNRLDTHRLVAACKAARQDPREVLQSSVVARAFTAHQLAALVEDTLPEMLVEGVRAAFVVDPLDLYADEEAGWETGLALLQRTVAKLRLVARRRPGLPLFLVQHPGVGTPRHWEVLAGATPDIRVLDAQARVPLAQARLDAPLLGRPRAPEPLVAPMMAEPEPLVEVSEFGPHLAHVPQPA